MKMTAAFRKQLAKRSDELKENVDVTGDDSIDFNSPKTQQAFKKVLIDSMRDAGMVLEPMLFGMAWKVKGEDK